MFKFRKDQNKSNMKDLKKRTPIPVCIGMSYKEYVRYETKDKGELASFAYQFMEKEDSKYTDLLLKIRYYCDCFEDLSEEKQAIKELWTEFLQVYSEKPLNEMKSDLLFLAIITVESGISRDIRESLDQKILDLAISQFNKQFGQSEYVNVLEDIVEWYYFRAEYYRTMLIGSTETELDFLRQVVKRNEREFQRIKNEIPRTFIGFSKCVQWFYRNLPEILDSNYDIFYRRILLDEISVLRNMGELERMSESIYLYNKEMRKKQKASSWLMDFFFGYGEKPFRLVRLFLLIHIIFGLVLFLPWLKLNGLDYNAPFLNRLLDIIYFNNTTFLTIGYGDFSPGNLATKVVVMFQQVSGFVVAGSFVTLALRKLFRF